jgi:hypothetical protein
MSFLLDSFSFVEFTRLPLYIDDLGCCLLAWLVL